MSNFGTAIQTVGASWMMTSLVSSAQMIALVQAASSLPIGLLALPAGALADIYDRRRLMLIAQSLMLGLSAVLALLSFSGLVTPWTLLALTFLIGSAGALYAPAVSSSVGEMVPRADLPSAVALNSIGYNVARSVGPAIGGGVVALGGPPAAFLGNALSYLGVIGALLRWKREPADPGLPRERIGPAMIAGIQYASLSPAIRTTLVRTLAFAFAGSAVWALLPVIARDLVGGGPLTFGLLLGSLGVGAVIGGIASTQVQLRMTNEAALVLSSLAFGAGTLVTAASPFLPLTQAALLIGGIGWVLTLSTCNVTVQLSTPRWVLGRALALQQTVVFGSMGVGSWLWGRLAERQGLAFALALSGVLMLLLPLLGRWLRMPELEGADLEPSQVGRTPRLLIDVKPRSGPVVVAIEYQVAVESAPAFARAMSEHRRVRLRDGARGWQLMQDLEFPTRWIERYHYSTWLNCLRQQQRATQADLELEQRIARFHSGAGPPKVSYMLERPPGAAPAGLRPEPGAEEADAQPVIAETGLL